MSSRFSMTTVPTAQALTSLHYAPEFALITAGDAHGQVHLQHYREQELEYVSSFTSHTVSFDTDTIQHESDSIVALECLYALPHTYSLLVANERVVKLWSASRSPTGAQPKCIRRFLGGHEFRIHSISANNARQQFLTCDDLSLNLWDIERADCTYRAADHKPRSIKDLKEVLLHATFHHSNNSLLLTTSTSGTIRIGDLRVRAKVTPAVLELRRPKMRDSQYSDILCSVTGADFSLNGDLIFARDFQTIFIWDLKQPIRPISSVKVTADSRCVLEAINNPSGLGKFEIRAIENGCVTGGFEGHIVAVDSSGADRSDEELTFAPDCFPHVVSGAEATFTTFNNAVVVLPHWPTLPHM